MSMQTLARPVVLADIIRLPRTDSRVQTAALVLSFTLLTALLAQVRIHVGWTPVPITGQTFGVLLAGAALGSRKGALSMGLYVLLGLFLPFYTGGESGWTYFTGVTGGYLVGMVLAAYLVGMLAERKEDRSLLTSLPAMLFGSAIVYLLGVPWLAHAAHMSAQTAITKGVAPFLLGDALKALLAGALFPAAWKLVNRR